MELRHIDLFSGIGGFALAAREVWGDDYQNVFFCEMNKYCQAVLRKNFGKDIKIYDDIRTVTADAYKQTEPALSVYGNKGKRLSHLQKVNDRRIDLLTGGFPCQPFSQAGQRRGTDDDRYLWPEMLRVIKEFRPTWIIGENVAGILSMAQYESDAEMGNETDLFGNRVDTGVKSGRGILYGIIGDLEQIGYSVQTFVIPACSVNAPHRRDRVWIVANTSSDGRSRRGEGVKVEEGLQQRSEQAGELEGGLEGPYCDDTDAKCSRLKESEWMPKSKRLIESHSPDWERSWLEVANETCTRILRMDDGVSEGIHGLKLSAAGHRVERLKALGNAIVPQVATEIMRAIKEIEG